MSEKYIGSSSTYFRPLIHNSHAALPGSFHWSFFNSFNYSARQLQGISQNKCVLSTGLQWTLDLADTDIAENLDFRTLLNNWDINLRFQVQSPLNIAENIDLEDESPMTDFWAKLIFHSLYFLKQKSTLNTNEPPFELRTMQVF